VSDTPITDSYQNCYDGRFLPAMEKLERENAALREQLSNTVTTKYHDQIVQESINERVKLTNGLKNELCVVEAFQRIAVMERDALIKENTALRADKERLDWLQNGGNAVDDLLYEFNVVVDFDVRAAIDAAKKETK